jgi:uncharacterized coiled-coil protein SlyX
MITLQGTIDRVKSEIRVSNDGKATVSISGAARLADVTQQALSKQFTTYKGSKLTQTLTQSGFDTHNLEQFSTDGIPDVALFIILEYYAYDAGRYCTKLAKMCMRAFSAMGIRTWLQQSVNWVSPEEIKNQELKIANEAITLMRNVEQNYPGSYRYILEALSIRNDQTEALNTSLIANRLGLAFNKQIKAFEAIQDATSPDAFDELKEAYYKLAEQHAELLKIKTPQPRVEYVEKFVDRVVTQTEYKLDARTQKKLAKQEEKIEEQEKMIEDKDQKIAKLEDDVQFLLDQLNGRDKPKQLKGY